MRYYGQFEPPVDRYIHETFFMDRRDPGFFVECGAFDGELESSCKFFEETLGWTGVNIEASPLLFPLLQERRPDSINLNIALSDRCGTATFHHVSDELHGEFLGWGSIDHRPEQAEAIVSEAMIVTEHTVRTWTWRNLPEVQSQKRIDLFVLDVEGHELSVIDGMSEAKVLPELFCVEHTQVDPEMLGQALDSLGYSFHSSLHVNSFYQRRIARLRDA